jgi:polyketide biosynthesis enoyl-CoA hydratase PksI
MLLSARTFYGRDLKERGVPFPVLRRAEVLPYALELAENLAEKPRASLITLKDHLVSDLRAELPSYIEREVAMHDKTFHQPEVRDLIQSRYLGG